MSTLLSVNGTLQRAAVWRPGKWNLSLAAVLLILGIVLSLQWKGEPNAYGDDSPSRSISDNTIRRLEEDQKSFKARIGTLQKQIQEYQQIAGSRKENLSEISKELERQKVLSGIVGLSGPGLKVIVDDSAKSPGPDDDPSHYIVHEYQLRDIVNLLWRSGAEAVSINDERLTNTSSVYCVGSTIMVNSTRMSPPYEIRAIGNAAAMEEMINNPNTLRKLKSEVRNYGVQLKVQRLKELSVPAYNGVFAVKYMAPSSRQ